MALQRPGLTRSIFAGAGRLLESTSFIYSKTVLMGHDGILRFLMGFERAQRRPPYVETLLEIEAHAAMHRKVNRNKGPGKQYVVLRCENFPK